MRITPYGAAGGEVTGSCYHIQTSAANILLDFGLFQGGRQASVLNRTPARVNLAKLNSVVLTHAHLDHVGRLPLLVKGGYRGPVHCTPATVELTALILRDAVRLQAQDLERHNRKLARAGRPLLLPLYTSEDVEQLLRQLTPVPYDKPVTVAPGITATYFDAGHMLGSTSIQITAQENGLTKTVIFSGDLGPKGALILQDYHLFQKADAVVMESTYGDRDHKPFTDTVEEFLAIVRAGVARRGKMLVPTFAVGRAQLLLTILAWALANKKVPRFPIYLDSPMAIEATAIYNKHPELFDVEMIALLKKRSMADVIKTLDFRPTSTARESMALNSVSGPCMILAGAGMCNAGRIVHHLRNNLFKPETAVLIVGFQGEGSLGRMLVDGAKQVKIFGEPVAVRASVHTLGGFSAHAGQTDLLAWFTTLAPGKPRVYLTHGEDRARLPLAQQIQKRFRLKAALPNIGTPLDL